MNETIRQLYARKSVRVYTDKPISEEYKNLILESAMQAPTAGNQQLYSIIDITDQQLKDRLAVSCDNQPFIAEAPMVLIFCVDFQKWYDLFECTGAKPRRPGVGDLMLAAADAIIAAQNAVVAAESLGIGSCYIGDILEQKEVHQEMLNLPQYVMPVCMLVFGYPTEQQKNRPKPERHKLMDIVMENGYARKDGDSLRKMFGDKTGQKPLNEWVQAFCKRKYNSDFSVEMTRSVAEYIKLWQ
ncbi:MAG: nitroreductase family protein [Parasporobacterium sp.]|nr:nitroreductase family protein [Parasporobacterium sp.]